jgi:hypothetical protein
MIRQLNERKKNSLHSLTPVTSFRIAGKWQLLATPVLTSYSYGSGLPVKPQIVKPFPATYGRA